MVSKRKLPVEANSKKNSSVIHQVCSKIALLHESALNQSKQANEAKSFAIA